MSVSFSRHTSGKTDTYEQLTKEEGFCLFMISEKTCKHCLLDNGILIQTGCSLLVYF